MLISVALGAISGHSQELSGSLAGTRRSFLGTTFSSWQRPCPVGHNHASHANKKIGKTARTVINKICCVRIPTEYTLGHRPANIIELGGVIIGVLAPLESLGVRAKAYETTAGRTTPRHWSGQLLGWQRRQTQERHQEAQYAINQARQQRPRDALIVARPSLKGPPAGCRRP